MYVYIPIIIVFLIIVVRRAKGLSFDSLIRIDFWMRIGFLFLLVNYLFGGYHYNYKVSIETVIYVVIAITLFSIGNSVGFRNNGNTNWQVFSLNIRTISLVALFGAVITIFDYFRLNTIVLGARIEDQKLSIISVFGTLLTAFGIISWLYEFYHFIRKKKPIGLYGYLGLLSYISVGIISGGRQAILLLIIETTLMVFFAKKLPRIDKIKLKHKSSITGLFVGVFIAVAVVVYLLSVSVVRSQIESTQQKVIIMESIAGGEVDDQVIDVAEKLGPFTSMYIEFLFYYSHEYPRLSIMVDKYDYPPILGLCQFHYIGRRLSSITEPILKDQEKYAESLIEQSGMYYHTWGTMLNGFIIDYGKIGSLFMLFVFGVIGGLYTKNSKKKDSCTCVIRQSIACGGGLFAIQFSPFYDMLWFVSLFFLVFVKIKDKERL